MYEVRLAEDVEKDLARIPVYYRKQIMDVITRRGRPAAILVGVEGKDWEDIVLQTSPRFWKLIEERRKQPTISIKELRTRLKKRKRYDPFASLHHS